jgi:hypothetical protein
MKESLFALIVFTLIVAGCGGGGNSGDGPNEDYIEITSVEPDTVTEGEEVSFVINFDFRLASESAGLIYAGYNDDSLNPHSYTVQPKLFLTEPMTGSESITISATPVLHELPESYNVYLNISPNDHDTPWTPLVSDKWQITVNQATNSLSYQKNENGDFANSSSIKCNYDECISENE